MDQAALATVCPPRELQPRGAANAGGVYRARCAEGGGWPCVRGRGVESGSGLRGTGDGVLLKFKAPTSARVAAKTMAKKNLAPRPIPALTDYRYRARKAVFSLAPRSRLPDRSSNNELKPNGINQRA